MERFKRTFSLRKKKDHVPESSKPHQWQEDEQKVRDGTCSFQVRYLGCIEVFESRGIHICEEAVKALKARKNRSVWKRMSMRRKKKKSKEGDEQQCKGKYQRAILYVSGDALRVVDEISKGLIVDQTIEKVSFCAPDRNHEKGFAYICRDGTTRRWMCHGFLAVKESHGDRKANFGERLSHAVGCAFAICLEKKQKREKESVQVTYNDKGTSFTRLGSFRQASLTERMADPQSTIIPEPVPAPKKEPEGGISNVPLPPSAIERPRASVNVLQKQASFRGFGKLQENSPFKRQLSLRLNELPSTLERTNNINNNMQQHQQHSNGPVSPIPEASPSKEQGDSISAMCAQLSQGLTALAEEPSGMSNAGSQPHIPAAANPWSAPSSAVPASSVSDAEFWLQSTATAVSSHQPASFPPAAAAPTTTQATINGQLPPDPFHFPPPAHAPPAPPPPPQMSAQVQPPLPPPPPAGAQMSPHLAVRAPHLSHLRSHSLDMAPPPAAGAGRAPTLSELAGGTQFQSQPSAPDGSSPWKGEVPKMATNDPFDAAWMSRSPNRPATNPFQGQSDSSTTPAFTVNL